MMVIACTRTTILQYYVGIHNILQCKIIQDSSKKNKNNSSHDRRAYSFFITL
jgi:hypothetical protein